MDHDSTHPGGPPRPLTPSLPLLGVGDLVAGRYRIRRFLGQGAVGEVFAAQDLELDVEVALKILKPRDETDDATVERFRREVLLARRISHANVCRIFDLGVHLLARDGREARPLRFLTMELLAGETLARRIDERGALPEEEVRRIAAQLAAGLGAAHRAGVIHRDLKSSNVVLVREGGTERAVITDFGLARDHESSPGSSVLTHTGGVVGTPAYMSPEQVEGRPATPRSDLYALGVVMYEMLTDDLPFAGESPLSVAVKRLQQPPIPIEARRGDVSPRMRALVGRLLERDPAERFLDADEVGRALTGTGNVESPRRRRRRWALAAAVAALLLAGWALGARLLKRETIDAPLALTAAAPTRATRASIAVLGLRNVTGRSESDWLSDALAEMLSTELAAGEQLRIVPGETVARAISDLALPRVEALARDSLARLGRAVATDWVLAGGFTALGQESEGALRLDLRLQRIDGTDDRALSVRGSESQLFDIVAEAGRELRAAVGVGEPDERQVASARAELPGTEGAVRLYTAGLAKLRAGEPLAARELFEASLAEDPDAALAWLALARSWGELGYDEREREAARTAYDKSGGLSRAEALAVEAHYRLAAGEWEVAIENLRALWRLWPDDLEQGLTLVEALAAAGYAAEAPPVLAALRALPPPAGGDPRIDLAAARVADGQADFAGQLEAARAARRKAEEVGARQLAARALYEEGLAQRRLGDAAAARAALTESRRRFADLGLRAGAAQATFSLANLERAGGRLDEAAAAYAEARATFAAIGNRGVEARVELMQGYLASERGDLVAARAAGESALAKLREVGDRRGVATALANLGSIHYELGDLERSLAFQTEALAEFRGLADPARVLVSLQNHAMIQQERGDFTAAGAALDEALATAREIGDPAGSGQALKGLGDLAAERGDFELAADQYAAALSALGDGQELWRLRVVLAQAVLARDRGEVAEAATQLAEVAAAFDSAGAPGEADEARLERVRALIPLGRLGEAASQLDEAAPAARRSAVRHLRRLAQLAAAELSLARGDAADALRQFEQTWQDSRSSGMPVRALEARAGMARAAAAAGRGDATRMLDEVAAEARRLGCGRVLAGLGDLTAVAQRSTPQP